MKGMFLFQTGGISEKSRQEVVATLKSGGVTHLLLKAMDGNSWEGYWDRSTIEVNSLADLALWDAACKAEGIVMWPWMQPDDPGYNTDMNVQVDRYAAIANEFGVCCLDVEPGSDYWYTLDTGNIGNEVPFLTALHAAAPDAKMIINFPGKWAWGQMTPFIVAAVRSGLDIEWWIQSYWDVTSASHDQATLRSLGVPDEKIKHIISTAGAYTSMLDWLENVGNVLVWDFAHMNAEKYTALAAFESADPPPVPGPDPTPAHVWQSPGFAQLARLHVDMGDPTGEPYSDNVGNVWQESVHGRALWVKDFNTNYWLQKAG